MTSPTPPPTANAPQPSPSTAADDWAARKAEQKRINKINKRRKELEEKIEKQEARKAELDDMLMKPENAANMKLVNEYTDIQAELEKLEEEYFSLEE